MIPDPSRPVATPPDIEFALSVDEVLQRYVDAGIPRTPRSIQRYCALGHLDCRRVDTPFGEKWLVTPSSVERHIAYIKEVTPAPSRDQSRRDTTGRDNEKAVSPENGIATTKPDKVKQPSTSDDGSRPVATPTDADRYVTRLEGENEFLRGQIAVKDIQIKDLTERARETNHLIAGLQRILSPLLGTRDRHVQPADTMGDSSIDNPHP